MLAPVFWPLCLGIVLAILMVPAAAGRSRDSLREAWVATAFLLPCWVSYTLVNSIAIDLRGVAALGGLVLLMAIPSPGARLRWTLLDSSFAAMLAGMMATELTNGTLQAGTVPSLLLGLGLPYLAGRMALGGAQGVVPLTRACARVVAVGAVLGAVEMLSTLNLADKLSGRFSINDFIGEGTRYGLRRAHGNVTQPISYGMCGILLLPWALYGAALARAGRGPRWWRWLPAAQIAAILSSLSRGPVLASGICLYLYAMLTRRRLRLPMAALGLTLGLVVYIGQEDIMNLLAMAAEEGGSTQTVTINGRVERYSGTRHRQLLYMAYDRALRENGSLGMGVEQVSYVPARYKVPRVLNSIDNHFILHQLTYGVVGLYLLDLFILATQWTLLRVALRRGSPYATLAAALFAGQGAVSLNLFSVYLSGDFRSPWLFGAGLAATLANLDQATRREAPGRPAPAVSRSRPS